MKRFYFIAVIVVCCFGCKKDKRVTPQDNLSVGLHVLINAGNSQTDTIGNVLKDSIVVKVINNGLPAQGYTLQFTRSGCRDLQTSTAISSAKGTASFAWYLSGTPGPQLLKVVVIDNNGHKADSTSVNATAIDAGKGWHKGGCLQNFPVGDVSALPSGRILAAINASTYPYYSDDNAASWLPLKTFSGNYVISKILSTSAGVYMATQNAGVFFSGDNGQTWSNITNGIPNNQGFADMTLTPSGRLIVTNTSGLFVSTDNGQSWDEEDYQLPTGASYYPCEQLNGDLYVIGSDVSVYKLPNHTGTWLSVASLGGYLLSNVGSMYVDEHGNMFIGSPKDAPGAPGSLYESTDGGQTWNQLFTHAAVGPSYANITDISKLNGTYYFSFAGLGIYQTTDLNSFSNQTIQFSSLGLLTYTVSKNSTFVLGSPGFGIFYNKQ